MAVQDKYVDSNAAAGKRANAAFINGGQLRALVFNFEVAAADDDGSVYRIAKALDPDLIPVRVDIFNDAITSSSDWDLGLYDTDLGAVITKDLFLNAGDLSSAHAVGSPLSGLSAVDPANLQKRIYEHAGHTITTKKGSYDLALTANTVGSAAGTVSGVVYFVQG